MRTIIPVNGTVLIRRDALPQDTVNEDHLRGIGGIAGNTTTPVGITNTSNNYLRTATVIEAGPPRLLECGKVVPKQVSNNDRILIGSWCGSPFDMTDPNLLFISETEIYGIIK